MAKINQRISESYIDNTQSKRIRPISNRRDYILIEILREVGCTVSEITNIKVEDIKTNSIVVGLKRRKVEISTELSRELKDFIEQELKGFKGNYGFLFSTRQSPKLNVRRVQQIVKRYLGTNPCEIRHKRIIELAEKKGTKKTKKICGLKGLKIKSFLKKDEIQRLQNKIIDEKDSIAFNILLESGCTISELVNIRVDDVRKDHIIFGVDENKKRSTHISDELISNIKEFIDTQKIEGYLFKTRQSDKISDKRIFQILRNYGKSVDVKLNPQILRNTKIAIMLQSGEDERKIGLELGIRRLEFSSYGSLNTTEVFKVFNNYTNE